jgi:hypothetical protein
MPSSNLCGAHLVIFESAASINIHDLLAQCCFVPTVLVVLTPVLCRPVLLLCISSAQGLRQAETEFLLWQSVSNYPFCQLITDLNSGGVAFFALPSACSREAMRVMYKVLPTMDDVWQFISNLVKSLT